VEYWNAGDVSRYSKNLTRAASDTVTYLRPESLLCPPRADGQRNSHATLFSPQTTISQVSNHKCSGAVEDTGVLCRESRWC
jgi:hypothetical protein